MGIPTIGIIAPVDLVNSQPLGGLIGFLAHVLGEFGCTVRVYGMALNRNTTIWEAVAWRPHVEFVPLARVRYPSPVPLRFKALLFYSLYRSRILRDGIDLLYVHSVESALPFLFPKAALPLIYHQHGSHNPVQLSVYRFARLKIFQLMFDKMLNVVHRKADWIIAIDSYSLDQVRRSGAGHKVSLLMNAVNTQIFRPDLQARQRLRHEFSIEKKRVVLFVGRMEEGKGIDKIIDAISILNAREGMYCAFIVGEGSQKKCLQELVEKRHMEPIISFTGAVPHHQLKDFYNMGDVLLLPSEREGIPMVILEALACGTPVIATDVGGVADLISDGESGILLNTNSPASIANAVLQILASPIDRKSIAKGIECYRAERAVQELEGIFSRLVADLK